VGTGDCFPKRGADYSPPFTAVENGGAEDNFAIIIIIIIM
jgi:hypothetical protein